MMSQDSSELTEYEKQVSAGCICIISSIILQPIALFLILGSENLRNALLLYIGVLFLTTLIFRVFRQSTSWLLVAFLASYSLPILGTDTEGDFGLYQPDIVHIVAAAMVLGALLGSTVLRSEFLRNFINSWKNLGV